MLTWTAEGGAYVLRDETGAAMGRVRRSLRTGRWYAGWQGPGRTGEDHWLESTPLWSASAARTEVVKRLGVPARRVNPVKP